MRRRVAALLLTPLLGVFALSLAGPGPAADGAALPLEGSQGTDTRLPLTDSAVTVQGRGAFANLQISVNQTAKLTNQAVSISWTGAAPTSVGAGTFSGNYLQIMQCWGDDDGTNAANPGPSPEQCQFGAVGSITAPPSSIYPDPYAISRILGVAGWQGLDLTDGWLDLESGFVWRPFRAVDGTVVNRQIDPNFTPGVTGGNSWLNPYFNAATTNEIAGARTYDQGTGSELFEVQTGLQSSGLGCGQKVQPVTGGGTKVPKCWIVIVPRADAVTENAGTPASSAGSSAAVATSPLRSAQWANRIAIPIDFIPVDSPCALGADERRIAGNDLVTPAIASWQPSLCGNTTLPPYSYAAVGDNAARLQLSMSSEGGPGMVVVNKPLEPSQQDPYSPEVYAPIGVSGITVGFNIERNPRSSAVAELPLGGLRVAELNLTPRLVAKLLTQSYQGQLTIGGTVPTAYTWATTNPGSPLDDPDFLRFNPEFALLLNSDGRTFSGLQLPSGTSDAAELVWKWVLADPEAAAWLAGTPDQWGMKVNPWYASSAASNPSGGAFGDPAPQAFPKADPYCFQAPPRGTNNSIIPPPLCGTDWMPYSRNFYETARVTRTAYDGARVMENLNALNSSQVWSKGPPQFIGRRMMLSITDTTSAIQFGVQMARLSRAGDDGAQREFIAPDTAALNKGVAAMVPSSVPSVLQPNHTAVAPGAYPLTVVSYAAIKPLSLDTATRADFAAFLDYAVGPGQVVGIEVGQLPKGYAPLPDALATKTAAAAASVRTMQPVPTTTTTTTTVRSSPPFNTFPSFPPGGGGDVTETGSTETLPETSAADTTVPDDGATATTTTVAPGITPSVDVSGGRYAILGLGVALLGSAFGVLEITKRPRRSQGRIDALIEDEA